ncbi:MAG TPA: A/G-specific adenine glycosylase [Burkholderiaceae bacterium]|nr:A/G-specific adenine glycosylase [Burkholderiaceae bacterium]
MSAFAGRIVDWQARHGRHDLPWQGTRDPYRIWLSEVMLQQTQVGTVIPYYRRFVEVFPDVTALAAAPVDEVMRLWSGLGYYSRARNLHRCAQQVVSVHGGAFPTDPQVLAGLPGIGRSTAAAIAVFSRGVRAAILDGNVRRVLCRVFGVEGWPGQAIVERRLWALAEQELPATGIEAYTQGMMDLGATVCTRHRPACDRCPVALLCVARRHGSQARLPSPRPPRATPVRSCRMFAIRRGDEWLLEKRPPTGIWGGLWSLPQGELRDENEGGRVGLVGAGEVGLDVAGSDPASESLAGDALRVGAAHGLELGPPRALAPFVHAFTHFRLRIEPVLCEVAGASAVAAPGAIWLPADEVGDAALPQPIKRLLQSPEILRAVQAQMI